MRVLRRAGGRGGHASFAIDPGFRPEDREGDERRFRERVTRASTDPTVSALADLDVLDGEKGVPVLEDIRDVEPDPGEITREGTRETVLSEPPTRVSAEPLPDMPAPPAAAPPASRSGVELLLVGALLGGAVVAVVGGVVFAAWWFTQH
jgi:hypothetical protein